ncbi:hypothetical protein B0A55_07772 [Friedmanniomyces simplex]|uniref:BRCT domain-containing protein n=1 Tax=Friedmanniomyces simplex TaxID=329884 RepID=A0A4U0XF20_9PEZI|nr:hypothetical protein B0A55_07772 [Friedmanniomyces simplex]
MPPRRDSAMKQSVMPVVPTMTTSDPDNLDRDADSETIEVKHPAKTPTTPKEDAEDDAETEDESGEGDLDASSHNAPPTELTTVDTIAESPAANVKSNKYHLDRLAPATQPGGIAGSSAPVLDTESPLSKKTAAPQGETQAEGDLLVQQAAMVRSDGLGEDDMVDSAKKAKRLTTYARSRGTPTSSRQTPQKARKVEKPIPQAQDDEGDEEDSITVAGQPAPAKVIPIALDYAAKTGPAFSSSVDGLDTHGIASKTARRSMLAGSKRGIDEVIETNEEADAAEEPSSPEQPPRKLPKAAQPEEDGPKSRKLKHPRKFAALSSSSAKPQRSSNRMETVEAGDNITVVPRSTPAAKPAPAKPSAAKSKKSKPRGKSSTPQIPISHHNTRATPASTTRPGPTTPALDGANPQILLSGSVKDNTPLIKWLKSRKTPLIDAIPANRTTHFICVVPEKRKLATSAKVLRSLAMGKFIVTEDWLKDSKARGVLLDPPDYVHPEVDVDPHVVAGRGRLFEGKRVFFTERLCGEYGEGGWRDVRDLVMDAGAEGEEQGEEAVVVFLGAGEGDPDVARLRDELGCRVYGKGLLARSLMRGWLDLEGGEFVLGAAGGKGERGKKKKGKGGKH